MCRLRQTRQRAATRVDLLKRPRNVCGCKKILLSFRSILKILSTSAKHLFRKKNTQFLVIQYYMDFPCFLPFSGSQPIFGEHHTPFRFLYCYTFLYRTLCPLPFTSRSLTSFTRHTLGEKRPSSFHFTMLALLSSLAK